MFGPYTLHLGRQSGTVTSINHSLILNEFLIKNDNGYLQVSPIFDMTGVFMISLALVADAIIGNHYSLVI